MVLYFFVAVRLTISHVYVACSAGAGRTYRVNVKAVSGDERFDDSPLSNTLTVNDSTVETVAGRAGVLGSSLLTSSAWPYDDDQDDDDDGLPVRVIRLTESAIHLDWSECQLAAFSSSLVYYRVVWSSTSNHAVRVSTNVQCLLALTRLVNVKRSEAFIP